MSGADRRVRLQQDSHEKRRSHGPAKAGHCVRMLGLLACCCVAPALARAQSPRWEVSAGVGLLGGASAGESEATLRGNSQSGPGFRLFASEARFERAPTFEARVGSRLTSRLAIDVHGLRVRQDLRVSVTADAEGAPAITVAERVDRYVIDAGLVVLLDELRVAGLVPFAGAGAGYLRQLHEGAALVEQGHVYHVGAGVKRSVLVRRGRLLDGIGVRGDARLYVVGPGLSADDSPRPFMSVTGSVVFAF
jgi:hypothetical protein